MRMIEAKVPKELGKQRTGKGFSRTELAKAGLTIQDALRKGIPTDPKRKTAHDENVQALHTFVQAQRAKVKEVPSKSKKKSKS